MSNAFVIIKTCYVHNQWYAISCATLYFQRAKIPEKGAGKEESNGISFLEQSLKTAIKVNHQGLFRRPLQLKYVTQNVRFRWNNKRIITRVPM